MELYRVAGRPVYLPHLVVGLGLTALLTVLNYRGVRLSATFQNWTSFGTLALFVIFVALGASHGSTANFPPLFTHAPLVSILLVIQIVPYFMTGFESVGKAAEEASPDFRARGFFRAIWAAIFIGIFFYACIVAAVAFVAPWFHLTNEKFMTAVAFQQAVGSRWIVNVILAAALLSLFKCFNGNFLAASRLLFAIGRRGMVDARAGVIHPRFQTPSVAVLCVGPSLPCAPYSGMRSWFPSPKLALSLAPSDGPRPAPPVLCWHGPGAISLTLAFPAAQAGAGFGLVVAIAMALMKIVPAIPGHFTVYEWLALGIWILFGVAASLTGRVRAPDRKPHAGVSPLSSEQPAAGSI